MPQTFFQQYLQTPHEKRLQFQLSHTFSHSPFYRKIAQSLGINPEMIKSFDDIKKIPFTNKSDLQNKDNDFCCLPKSSIIDYTTTSGTAGEPVTLMLSESDLQRLTWNEKKSFETAACKKEDIIQLMTTVDRRFMAGLAYFLGARELGAGIVRVGNGVPEMQWDSIKRVNPNVIVCVPSFILKLAEYAIKNGIDYKNCSVKKAICIGEPVRDAEFKLNTLGKKINEIWPIELFSTYASSEMGAAFTECEQHKGGHLISELLHIEIVDEDGNEVKENESGELVITTLGMESMPLVRFKTGDICFRQNNPCSCGNTNPRLSSILGRKNQMIKFKGTTLYPGALYDVLENFPGIKNYQIEVFTNELGTDEVLVHIGSELSDAGLANEIKSHFQSKLRVAPNLVFELPENLQKRIMPEASRKAIKFIDSRKKI